MSEAGFDDVSSPAATPPGPDVTAVQADGPNLGDMLAYCLDAGPHAGEWRPAVVVRVWSTTCVNLMVFTDGANDYLGCPLWVTSAVPGDGPRCWRPRGSGE